MSKKTKAQQDALPGMEQKESPLIKQLASDYYETDAERRELTVLAVSKRQALEKAMEQEGVPVYRFRDLVVKINVTKKASVRRASDEDSEEVEAAASKRATKEMVEDLKATADVPAEPTAEAIETNVRSFLKGKQKAEAAKSEDADEAKTNTFDPKASNDAGLSYEDYLAWAKGTEQKNPASVAKMAQNKRDRDQEVLDFLFAQKKGNGHDETADIPANSKDLALYSALMLQPESAARWDARQREHRHGISDEALTQAIRLEFGIDQVSSHQKSGVHFKVDGGKIPKFWFWVGAKPGKQPTLQGERLLVEAARVLKLTRQKKAAVKVAASPAPTTHKPTARPAARHK